jgi:ABC-2 type transport system ATP-binding protein
LSVIDEKPGSSPEQLGRIGFVAQDTPVYPNLTIATHLHMGAALNPHWDAQLAERRMIDLGLDPSQRAGGLSGGQRAQLALTLAIAKRPSLLLLDEPVASLDPLARREFLATLMEVVAEHEVSVILSSHLVADLERVCDYLVVLAASRVQANGEIDDLLASHHRLVGTRQDFDRLPDSARVIEASHVERQTTVTIASADPILDPAWSVEEMTLEDLVLAYMSQAEEQRRELVRANGGSR